MVPLHGGGHRLDQMCPSLSIARGGRAVVAQLDARAPGEALDRLREVEVLDLAHERDDIAAGLATEAVVEALLGVDGERRGLLGVERAQTHPPAPHLAQGDVLAGDLHEVDGGPHLRDVLVEDAHPKDGSRARRHHRSAARSADRAVLIGNPRTQRA